MSFIAHRPSAYYYKNFKGSENDREYFYRGQTAADDGIVPLHQAESSDSDSAEERASVH